MILSSPLERFYIKVLKNNNNKKIKPLFFIQDERDPMKNKKSCAITWYHELPMHLAVGLIILNNSEHASEKATCPEEGVDYVWLQKVQYLSQKRETGTLEVCSFF